MRDVLVVDDEPTIRELLVLSLTSEGFNVRHASDGAEALTVLEAEPPDCMVLDVMMPKVDGFGVLRSMRKRQLAPETRVIVLTCRTDERDFVRGWELGADDYVTKPFDPDSLTRKINEVLSIPMEILRERRAAELQKAQILDRLEASLRRPE